MPSACVDFVSARNLFRHYISLALSLWDNIIYILMLFALPLLVKFLFFSRFVYDIFIYIRESTRSRDQRKLIKTLMSLYRMGIARFIVKKFGLFKCKCLDARARLLWGCEICERRGAIYTFFRVCGWRPTEGEKFLNSKLYCPHK